MKKSLCTANGCDLPESAKGYCHKHYERCRQTGNPLGKWLTICEWPGCDRKTKNTSFCSVHTKIKRPPGTSAGWCKTGPKNHNYRGGIAEYPNQSTFKKNRLIILEQANYKCVECRGLASHAHHKDFSKDNHALDNLIPLCKPCHRIIHKEHNYEMAEDRHKRLKAKFALWGIH